MADLLFEPVYWNWFLLGLVLVLAEVLIPGTFLLWPGIAALCVGLVLMLLPDLSWQLQWLLFALLTLSSIVVWWLYFKKNPPRSDEPLLNRRGHQYIGRVFTLDAPIVNGQGRMRVDDTTWKITGADCAAGSQVQVKGVDGVVLVVEIANEV